MKSLCLRTDFTSTDGDSPAALGNRIAAAALEFGRSDGALEDERYKDPAYAPGQRAARGREARDRHGRSEPLAAALPRQSRSRRTACPIPGSIQAFIGPHWGHVASFALPKSDQGLPIDPGPPPLLGQATDAEFKAEAVEIIRRSSRARPRRRRDARHRAGRAGRQHASAPTTGTGHDRQPGDGPAVRSRTSSCGPTTPGPWPSTGPTARSRRRRPATGT